MKHNPVTTQVQDSYKNGQLEASTNLAMVSDENGRQEASTSLALTSYHSRPRGSQHESGTDTST